MMNGKTVCIVGNAPSRTRARLEPPEHEIWACSLTYSLLPRIDRWFEIHAVKHLRVADGQGQAYANYMRWLRDYPGTVYVTEPDPALPRARLYPTQEVIQAFGPYLTSTIAYMLALALYEGFSRVKLFGVDLALDTEYAEQRPCVEYLLGVAKGMGVKVVLPEDTSLLTGRRELVLA